MSLLTELENIWECFSTKISPPTGPQIKLEWRLKLAKQVQIAFLKIFTAIDWLLLTIDRRLKIIEGDHATADGVLAMIDEVPPMADGTGATAKGGHATANEFWQ